jgi:hypothetical protein
MGLAAARNRFLAIFLGNSKIVVLLFRWLLFRLMFLSGVVKLTSHDPVWRDWTRSGVSLHDAAAADAAGLVHVPVAARVPAFFHRHTLFIELAIPFLFFAPRPWRFWGAGLALFLQVLIFLTGNYTFFNLLTMSLCVFLFDDYALEKLRLRRAMRTRRVAVAAAAIVILVLSVSELNADVFRESHSSRRMRWCASPAPFQIANTYGLFASMTTTRPEIIVQGSNDGVTWLDYEFPYKPGDLRQPPHWVAPYQPRLDWQMWFAALSDYRATPWFTNFMVRSAPRLARGFGIAQEKSVSRRRRRSTCARSCSIIRSPISRRAARPGIGGRASRADCIFRRFRWKT